MGCRTAAQAVRALGAFSKCTGTVRSDHLGAARASGYSSRSRDHWARARGRVRPPGAQLAGRDATRHRTRFPCRGPGVCECACDLDGRVHAHVHPIGGFGMDRCVRVGYWRSPTGRRHLEEAGSSQDPDAAAGVFRRCVRAFGTGPNVPTVWNWDFGGRFCDENLSGLLAGVQTCEQSIELRSKKNCSRLVVYA